MESHVVESSSGTSVIGAAAAAAAASSGRRCGSRISRIGRYRCPALCDISLDRFFSILVQIFG